MKVALLGNPNTGKSSVFNMLTGMKQHVGNFPGITVDKKFGEISIDNQVHTLIDFPGTYSVFPRTQDEEVVFKALNNKSNENYPDALVVVVDASNLERNLLFFTQLYDLQLPIIMVLNMTDLAKRQNIDVQLKELKKLFPDAQIINAIARVKSGKQAILEAIYSLKKRTGDSFINRKNEILIDDFSAQEDDTKDRFNKIKSVIPSLVRVLKKKESSSDKWDRIFVHPIFGYVIFTLILLIIFQFIYVFASVPMDFIDGTFASLSDWLNSVLPSGLLTDLITQGIVPGIGGVLIFIPQIALLFFFIAIMEESGYLSRVVFIMDRVMRPFGLNGKSVVPLMSSVACAIPGVMAARTISDWKERMITILVAPLMSCSARIPVYAILIALVIPEQTIFGFLNVQGLVLFGLYALGLFSALFVAIILKWTLKTKEKGFHLMEIPTYKKPRLQNIGLTVFEKVKVFVWGAGKIIIAISILLWGLGTFGPSGRMDESEKSVLSSSSTQNLSIEEINQAVASARLENSYMGLLGKTIEPVIQPLGYDWKIGISLIASFAAREVFVGSMATIYSVGDNGEENKPLIAKMKNEVYADGKPVFTLASGVSLMIFYVFAMQCMATLAVVKRETKSWKWPLIQIAYMGVLAYLGAWIAFNLLS
ncbi:MAG: ferrous iron transport protein B [Flavobacteriales bacterium]|nr:ferrous iron transport protein B [Flavobacteriales bacterium]